MRARAPTSPPADNFGFVWGLFGSFALDGRVPGCAGVGGSVAPQWQRSVTPPPDHSHIFPILKPIFDQPIVVSVPVLYRYLEPGGLEEGS